MDDMFTLKELLAHAYNEVMRMDSDEISERFGAEIGDNKFMVKNLVNYSRAMTVKRTSIAGNFYCVLN